MAQKRILTIQDYSCLGRCSLTVALPIISSAGIECVGIPTAVLSNHTAGFKSWTYADLTCYMGDTVDKWKGYNTDFDCIYTGYLSTIQVPIVIDIISKLKREGTVILIDPAFADGGKLYPGFGIEHIAAMRKLVKEADITCPNLTEACFITEREYKNKFTREEIESLLKALTELGPKEAIVSGLSFNSGKIGCLLYKKEEDKFYFYETDNLEGSYHGIGDVFASAIAVGKVYNLEGEKLLSLAHDLVHVSIEKTLEDTKPEIYYGVEFEKALPSFIKNLEKLKD